MSAADRETRGRLLAEGIVVAGGELADPPWVRRLPCLELDDAGRASAARATAPAAPRDNLDNGWIASLGPSRRPS